VEACTVRDAERPSVVKYEDNVISGEYLFDWIKSNFYSDLTPSQYRKAVKRLVEPPRAGYAARLTELPQDLHSFLYRKITEVGKRAWGCNKVMEEIRQKKLVEANAIAVQNITESKGYDMSQVMKVGDSAIVYLGHQELDQQHPVLRVTQPGQQHSNSEPQDNAVISTVLMKHEPPNAARKVSFYRPGAPFVSSLVPEAPIPSAISYGDSSLGNEDSNSALDEELAKLLCDGADDYSPKQHDDSLLASKCTPHTSKLEDVLEQPSKRLKRYNETERLGSSGSYDAVKTEFSSSTVGHNCRKVENLEPSEDDKETIASYCVPVEMSAASNNNCENEATVRGSPTDLFKRGKFLISALPVALIRFGLTGTESIGVLLNLVESTLQNVRERLGGPSHKKKLSGSQLADIHRVSLLLEKKLNPPGGLSFMATRGRGKAIYCNEAFKRYFGADRTKVVWQILHRNDLIAILQAVLYRALYSKTGNNRIRFHGNSDGYATIELRRFKLMPYDKTLPKPLSRVFFKFDPRFECFIFYSFLDSWHGNHQPA